MVKACCGTSGLSKGCHSFPVHLAIMNSAAFLPAPSACVARPGFSTSPTARTLPAEVTWALSVEIQEAPPTLIVSIVSGRKFNAGTSPMEMRTVWAGMSSPVSVTSPSFVTSLVATGHLNQAPSASAASFSLPKARGFWISTSVTFSAPSR